MRNKTFNITKTPKDYGCKRGLASMVDKCFDKKLSGDGVKSEDTLNQESAEEWRKPIIKNFEKRKVHSFFIDNIWGADLVEYGSTQVGHKLTRINTSPTQVNTNQNESTTRLTTQINTSPTQVNKNQHGSRMSQHEFEWEKTSLTQVKTSQHESIELRSYHSLSKFSW